MIGRPKYDLAPESRDKVSCDYTGRRPVLRGRLDRIQYCQPLLFHRQAGVLPRRQSLCQASEESRDKNLLEGLLDRAECCTHSRGHPLHKSPLLLEGLLQSCIGRLRVLEGDPCQYGGRLLSPLNFLS